METKESMGADIRATVAMARRLLRTPQGQVIGVVMATVATTLSLLVLTKNIMFATAAEPNRSLALAQPSVEFSQDGDDGTVTCRISTSVTKSDGTPVTEDGDLSVTLRDEEGKVVATAPLSPSGDGEGNDLSAMFRLSPEEYKASVTMMVVPSSDDIDLDDSKFNENLPQVILEAKHSFADKQEGVATAEGGQQEPTPQEETPQRPRYSGTDFSDTFVIGDSVLALSAREGGYGDKVSESLPGVEYDVESGRYYDSDVAGDPDDGMIDIARRVAGEYDRYVIECGINDTGLTRSMADEFIGTLMREDTQIFFVNQRVIGGADDTTCSTIREVASENERVYEIDWNSLCSGNEQAWLVDNCHPNAEGAEALAGLIRDTMAAHAADVMVSDEKDDEEPDDAESVEDVLSWRDSEDIERADLRISTEAEIEGWARRIDAYLDGTELAGYGRLFAECAATYQVDPRLSPAISTIESGNGSVCVTDYNAWGWGGPGNWASWSSWEEAIEAHVSGLARNGYASMGQEECSMYCDAGYWDGDPSFCLKTEVLKI